MSRKRRPLRASFIVITAGASAAAIAAAAATACSSSSTNASSTDAAGATDRGPTATSCPASLPNNGDPCSGTLSCSYDAGMYCGFNLTSTAACMTGAWSVSGQGVGCNPGSPTPDASDDASDGGPTSNGDPDGGDAGD
jgi:hypothetical protein